MLFLCNIANVAQRTFEIVQKLRSCEHGDIINDIDKNVCPLRVPRLPRVRYRVKLRDDFVFDNGVVEVSLLRVWWLSGIQSELPIERLVVQGQPVVKW